MTLESQSTESVFSVGFHGEAVASGAMPVRDLAPSLLALGELHTRANALLNGEQSSVDLNFRATQRASFDVVLALTMTVGPMLPMLTGTAVTSAANLITLISGVNGLFGTIKRLRGATVAPGITINIHDSTLNIGPQVRTILEDREIRRLAKDVVAPVQRPGIERVAFVQRSEETQSVSKQEAEWFDDALADTQIVNETITPRQVLRVVAPNYEGGKWRLHNGSQTLFYAIEDPLFAKAITTPGGRRTGAGDYVIGQVRTIQRVELSGAIKNEYTILKVEEYRETPPSAQGRLPD